jgi:hypothetical protein
MVAFGQTGSWISIGFRTDEFPVSVFSPFHSENGCLDAPELLQAGSMQRIEGGGPKVCQVVIIRGA